MIRLGCVALFLLCPLLTMAAESRDAVVTQTITGADTTPPSIPADVDAFGVSPTTIQIDWSASIDNVGVTGYRLWRDGSLLATTTLTSFVDSGLATSTTYSYYVTAFDAVGNESASSTSVIAETLAPVVIDDAPAQSALVTRGVKVQDITVDSSTAGFTLQFRTNRYVKTRVRWELAGQPLGVSATDQARKEHSVTASNLQPGTTYNVFITALVGDNVVATERALTIQTDALLDTTAPPNVRNLIAVDSDGRVVLQWQNPQVADFARVRIVRSTRFFPTDEVDGWVVYEADGERFADTVTERPIYYTVFTIDAAGNVSSGAVVRVRPSSTSTDTTTGASDIATDITPPGFTSVPNATKDWPVYVSQLDVVHKITPHADISITPNVPFTIYVPATAVPGDLKTIVATLQHPQQQEQSFQFLLRYDTGTDRYAATLETLPERGQYNLTIQWFNFITKTTGSVSGTLAIHALGSVRPVADPYWLGWAFGFVLFLFSVRIIVRYVRERSV